MWYKCMLSLDLVYDMPLYSILKFIFHLCSVGGQVSNSIALAMPVFVCTLYRCQSIWQMMWEGSGELYLQKRANNYYQTLLETSSKTSKTYFVVVRSSTRSCSSNFFQGYIWFLLQWNGFDLYWYHCLLFVIPELTHLTWRKWLAFLRRYFQMHFCEWKVLYFD